MRGTAMLHLRQTLNKIDRQQKHVGRIIFHKN